MKDAAFLLGLIVGVMFGWHAGILTAMWLDVFCYRLQRRFGKWILRKRKAVP